jgi:hypothetical protein
LEEEAVMKQALLVVGKGSGQDIEHRLFVEIELDGGLVNYVNQDIEARGGGVKSIRVKGVAALIVIISLEVINIFGSCGRGILR